VSGLQQLATRARQVTLDQPATLGDGDCEALRPGLIGQPVNTITSFAYVGAGAWLASRLSRLPSGRRPAAAAYAALTAITGVGSIAYHGPQFAGAQFLHDAPIVGAFALGAVVPLWRLVRGGVPLPGWSTRLGAAMAATAVGSLAAYAAGGTDSPLCRPESLLQPHGLWHMGTAALIGIWGAALWAPRSDVDEIERSDHAGQLDETDRSAGTTSTETGASGAADR
jgi:hypothetical protein